jgi:hypothetical protein
MNDMKTYCGVYWDSFLAPLATVHGFSNPIILQKASNTHKAYDFLRLVYEATLVTFQRKHLAEQLRAGTDIAACTAFTSAELKQQIDNSTDDTFVWRVAFAFLDLEALIGRQRARRDDHQERIDAYNRLVMPMYEVNDHKFYTKMNMWYQMREQQLRPEFRRMKNAAESHQFKLLLGKEGTRSIAQDIKPEFSAAEEKDIPRTRRCGNWVGIDDITENFGRRTKRGSGYGKAGAARLARESVIAHGELQRSDWFLDVTDCGHTRNVGRKNFPKQHTDREKIASFMQSGPKE